MGNIVIRAENLGKSYIIGHEKKEKYTALRDVLANRARKMASKAKQIFQGGQLITGNELEEFWALKDVNFEIKQGDRVGIIGRNGAGKSTLLKVLSRITEPSTGRITLRGRVASLLEVGTGFHPELTGRENIFLNGAILGMSRGEVKRKFDEIVDFSGVEKFLDTPVKRYSSGMYVRLAFAVAAHLEPEILVVDEVLAVGDAEFQKKCLGKMEDVSTKDGRTVLFVSHNMASIQTLCNSGILMDKGTISYSGEIQSTVNNYLVRLNDSFPKNLAEVNERTGNQKVKITGLKFVHGQTNETLDILLTGQPVTLEFTYICDKPETVKDYNLSIAFSHFSGGEKLICSSQFVGHKITELNTKGTIRCFISKWPLNTATYQFRIHSEVNGAIADRIENAGQIKVEYGDFYGSGIIVPSHLNGSLIDHIWNVL